MTTAVKSDFGKLRSFFWPIHGHEIKKVLPMFLMLFCINFNYTILRDTKDAIVVNAPGSGAEIIPFLKMYGTVPCAFIFMMIYMKLSNILSRESLFVATLAPFLIFFGLFATVLYPNRDLIHFSASADWLLEHLPAGASGLVAAYRNWTYSLFYIAAELWGSVALSLLFWGFANEITQVNEAKRFYALFLLGAQVAMMISGPTIVWIGQMRTSLPPNVDAWGVALNYLMGFVIVLGLGTIALHHYVRKYVITDPRFFDPTKIKAKKKKTKMGIFESISFLARSRYIACLAVIVLSYGVCINLVEVIWKSQIKLQYPTENEYLEFMGWFSTGTGVATFLMLLFVSSNVVRRYGWLVAALVTPVVLALTGTGFFSFVLFKESLAGFFTTVLSPLHLAVLFGAAQNIMSKSSKYSLFDPTKEMAYIPLDDETKTKGKAAVDVLGARLGKFGGSLIFQGLLIFVGPLAILPPYAFGIMLVVVSGWLVAVFALSKQFNSLMAKREQEEEAKKETEAAAVQSEQVAPAANKAAG